MGSRPCSQLHGRAGAEAWGWDLGEDIRTSVALAMGGAGIREKLASLDEPTCPHRALWLPEPTGRAGQTPQPPGASPAGT